MYTPILITRIFHALVWPVVKGHLTDAVPIVTVAIKLCKCEGAFIELILTLKSYQAVAPLLVNGCDPGA